MVYFGGMTMHYLFDAKTGKTHKLLRSKNLKKNHWAFPRSYNVYILFIQDLDARKM